MGAYDTPSEKCPYCGAECEADWVDVGIGMVQCGPYHCWECGASEIGPELQDWYEGERDEYGRITNLDMKDGKIVMKDGHPFSELELDKGWYDPNKKTVSPYANTVGGVLVDHQTAKMMYDIGLLDEKKI